MTKHTYDFGIIGNCAFLAGIDQTTNVVWQCWPRFDSSFIFGSLLDKDKGGEFSIKPFEEHYFSTQFYIENTNILCTEIETADGCYRVTDFAPRFMNFERYFRPLMMIRKVEPLSGSPRVKVKCEPVGNYGETKATASYGSNHIEFLGLEKNVRLTTNISITYINSDLPILLNETKYLVLTYGSPLEAPLESTSEEFLRQTKRYWRRWVKSTSINKFYQKQVIRSALALKIHQFEDTGAIVAATTSSLPEAPGSGRCWDYRYCWMRDTYYILTAFNNVGHFEEMEQYFNYITNIYSTINGRFQPLYKITGEARIEERILDLEGYLGNKPVRVGNAAYTHIQNDVYGQVLISLLPLYIDSRFIDMERASLDKIIYDTLEKISKTMHEPDAGLWEFRDFAQYHCYTYLFHWAGASAALEIAKYKRNEKMAHLAKELKEMAAEKIEACYNPELEAYTQAIGSDKLDASSLQLILMNYLDPNSERAKKHLIAHEKQLKTNEGLFYRYKHADDFGIPETTFLICAFWYVEALACVGRIDEAIKSFEQLLQYSNHLGLLSEDVDSKTGSQWGNFPQAYSHVGLMNAAYRIAKKLDHPVFFNIEKNTPKEAAG